jgi:uncharacterized protein (TIGR02680 family)
MTPTVERLPTRRGLPRPVSSRFKPLRAGIRNVWEYDDQEFWFADGRLILRGQNTAGKSKALELLLPFVLDGDIRSERLDPFGSRVKTMYWNLLDFSDRNTAIGYCWVEFGRLGDDGSERYVTPIVGMRAIRSSGKRVETWFAVTPGRVGADLDLAPGDVPLTADRLRQALPERSVFSTSARDHRAAVDHALFGLGPDRYDALIHLLLQLRRPKLSEKLDMGRLGEYLSDALPPLERHRMESLATAFARLDEDTAEIERLEASSHQLQAFLVHYRAHAELQTRLRADAVRQANSQFDKVTETERRQREEHLAAELSLADVDERRQQLSSAIDRLTGQLEGLDLSKVHALQEVEKRAELSEAHAANLQRRAHDDRLLAEADGREATSAESEAASAEIRREQRDAECVDQAEAAGLGGPHAMHADQLLVQPDRAQVALSGAIDRRHHLLRQVRAAAKAADEVTKRIERQQLHHRQAVEELRLAEEYEAEQRSFRDTSAAALIDAVERWAADWLTAAAADLGDSVVADVLAGRRPSASPLLSEPRRALRDQRAAVGAERHQLRQRRGEAIAQRQRIEAETDDAPPARPGRPASRPDGCAPLWACVDFAGGLTADQRAGLESALEASGLLDALITPSGQLLEAETLDTWFNPADQSASAYGSSGGGLKWLAPVASGPMPEDAISDALRGVTAGGAVLSLDGRWSVGPLNGRWAKPAAEYIGAAARAEARNRRIAALNAEVVILDDQLAILTSRDGELVAEEQRLDAAEAAWPSPFTDALRDARRDLGQATEGLNRARSELSRRAALLEEARQAGRHALEALTAAEGAAACRNELLDDAFDALARYHAVLVGLVAEARHALDARQRASASRLRAESSAEGARRSEAEASDAVADATRVRGEADELRRTSGAEADAILARHEELSGLLQGARSEHHQLDPVRDEALKRLAAAAEKLSTTELERRVSEEKRFAALVDLARMARTELASLALGPLDPDRDLTQVTAGLNFARSAHDRLRAVAVDQPARDGVSNRFHNGMTNLRSQLGSEFDPYLDTSDGIEVCYATLNGAPVGVSQLTAAVEEQVRRRRETLSEEERELIERHLLTEVGTHLGERVHAAWLLVKRMNEQLAAHPTRSGVSLRLSWDIASDAGAGAEYAVRLLRQQIPLLDQPERSALAAFLHERVRAAREDSEGADVVERLAAALDYRRWHRFSIHRRADGRDERLTSRNQGAGSGGEQAKLAHLPLFAATAAYYSSAQPDAPHLLMLDEAFAGIDEGQRGDCMGMLVDLDLDMVLTNYSEWGCYPEVPAVAIYHLERTPGHHGVTALRFVWNQTALQEDDPWLDTTLRPPEGALLP